MIQINNLTFGYSKQDILFTDLNLSLDKGGVYGLLGKNGAGKSTLLKIIAGLLFPQEGNCCTLGQQAQRRLPSMLADIYFISEEIYLPKMTATHYVKLYSVFYPNFEHTLFQSYMDEFNLKKNKPLTSLSYGQKKKFLIAFGLATRCRLLMLDEPTNGLDIPSKSQFRKLIASSMSDEQLIIISTHQVHDIEKLIDTVVILDQANIIFNASLVEIGRRLSFEQQQAESAISECIYYEKSFGGYTVIKENNNDEETDINLEVLFNAVISKQTNIQNIFSRG